MLYCLLRKLVCLSLTTKQEVGKNVGKINYVFTKMFGSQSSMTVWITNRPCRRVPLSYQICSCFHILSNVDWILDFISDLCMCVCVCVSTVNRGHILTLPPTDHRHHCKRGWSSICGYVQTVAKLPGTLAYKKSMLKKEKKITCTGFGHRSALKSHTQVVRCKIYTQTPTIAGSTCTSSFNESNIIVPWLPVLTSMCGCVCEWLTLHNVKGQSNIFASLHSGAEAEMLYCGHEWDGLKFEWGKARYCIQQDVEELQIGVLWLWYIGSMNNVHLLRCLLSPVIPPPPPPGISWNSVQCHLVRLGIQWNLIIKRSDITKPSYNKVI